MAARQRRTGPLIALLGLVVVAAALFGWHFTRAITARPEVPLHADYEAAGPREQFSRQVKTLMGVPTHPGELAYVGDPDSREYHLPDCERVRLIVERQPLPSRAHAEALDYEPCEICKP